MHCVLRLFSSTLFLAIDKNCKQVPVKSGCTTQFWRVWQHDLFSLSDIFLRTWASQLNCAVVERTKKKKERNDCETLSFDKERYTIHWTTTVKHRYRQTSMFRRWTPYYTLRVFSESIGTFEGRYERRNLLFRHFHQW